MLFNQVVNALFDKTCFKPQTITYLCQIPQLADTNPAVMLESVCLYVRTHIWLIGCLFEESVEQQSSHFSELHKLK